jgi:hypothetical protein
MLRTLDDPTRLARTFAVVIPGFLQRRFNRLAKTRGYAEVEAPSLDDVMAAFEGAGETRPALPEEPRRAANL